MLLAPPSLLSVLLCFPQLPSVLVLSPQLPPVLLPPVLLPPPKPTTDDHASAHCVVTQLPMAPEMHPFFRTVVSAALCPSQTVFIPRIYYI